MIFSLSNSTIENERVQSSSVTQVSSKTSSSNLQKCAEPKNLQLLTDSTAIEESRVIRQFCPDWSNEETPRISNVPSLRRTKMYLYNDCASDRFPKGLISMYVPPLATGSKLANGCKTQKGRALPCRDSKNRISWRASGLWTAVSGRVKLNRREFG